LLVHLNGTSPFPAPYWVLVLGPTVEDRYDYAVVSDYARLSLFVLTRDVKRFEAKYKTVVLEKIKELGFTDFFDTAIPLVQEGCKYY
jgi:lipocalin